MASHLGEKKKETCSLQNGHIISGFGSSPACLTCNFCGFLSAKAFRMCIFIPQQFIIKKYTLELTSWLVGGQEEEESLHESCKKMNETFRFPIFLHSEQLKKAELICIPLFFASLHGFYLYVTWLRWDGIV